MIREPELLNIFCFFFLLNSFRTGRNNIFYFIFSSYDGYQSQPCSTVVLGLSLGQVTVCMEFVCSPLAIMGFCNSLPNAK